MGRIRSTRQQRAWYFYDWANSAYVTTTATVILGPYLTSLAVNAACPACRPVRCAPRRCPSSGYRCCRGRCIRSW